MNPDGTARSSSRDSDDVFAEKLERNAQPLRLFIRRRAGSLTAPDHDDLFQTVALRAYRHRDQFRGDVPGAFYRWLVKIAANTIIDFHRRTERRLTEADAQPLDAVPASVTSIVTRVSRGETLELANAALDDLPERRRRAFELCYVEGATLAEAAAELGISRATVWHHVANALATIRERIDTDESRSRS